MKTTEITVHADSGAGEERKARLVVCEECDNLEFIIFRIEGQDHDHIQCCTCDTSYCMGGECDKELTDAKQ